MRTAASEGCKHVTWTTLTGRRGVLMVLGPILILCPTARGAIFAAQEARGAIGRGWGGW